MRRFPLVMVLPSLGCLSGRAPAPASLPESVRLTPDTARYRLVDHRRVEQRVQGQALVTAVRTDLWLVLALTPADDALDARWRLDSAASAAPVGGFDRAEADAMRGSTFSAKVREDGSLTRFGADREHGDAVERVGQYLRDFLPRLPAGGARPGAEWTDTTELATGPRGLTVTAHAVSRRLVTGWTTWAGVPALEIATEGTYTLTGSGEQTGQELAVEGTGKRHRRQYLDPRGRFLGMTGADTADIEVRLVASGLVIPVRQSSVDTVEAWR